MTYNNNSLEQLIYSFSKLPGLGSRSARRIILHLLKDPQMRILPLAQNLQQVASDIQKCSKCGNLDMESVCYICNDSERDHEIIAVVETVAELWAIERSKMYKGKYHVLGGALSALKGSSPEELGLTLLRARIIEEQIEEVIIATNATMDGQTTAFYIMNYLEDLEIKTTRLASGIPIGGELDYLDEGTLCAALQSRKKFEEA